MENLVNIIFGTGYLSAIAYIIYMVVCHTIDFEKEMNENE